MCEGVGVLCRLQWQTEGAGDTAATEAALRFVPSEDPQMRGLRADLNLRNQAKTTKEAKR
jgi:hypothetical protein